MKKVISFSLWGNAFRYIGGALQNIELANIYFPDWICRFYIGKSTPENIINKIISFKNTEVIRMKDNGDWTGMFWRFEAIADPEVSIMLSRDVDSRLSRREYESVKEFEQSNKKFHIIRDHQYHNIPILGGLWGAKRGIIDNIDGLISEYVKGNFWQVDQNFLSQIIYPIVKNNSLIHDEFFDKKPFPLSCGLRNPYFFIGQAYNGDGRILDNNEKSFIEYVYDEDKLTINNYYEDLF